ncbi:substrate-binding domain-containing protein [Algoriphagus antarcticus]|uniref:Phosphate ABC transporter substrate-binding protein (PhoT family) n=1 Tax=Algoriphagus antarcticus TaxID=238540 RepID=A0A3E0DZC4_9BACT|nr:substrate-binding domain-containing protein [Algoriphagus antarcticus]REG90409.1 phosphate ABC transporter substrate-binding protein (PhoT family) [Algoriphagus antarcticus]
MHYLTFVFCVFFLQSCSTKTSTVKVKGSDTEVNLAVLLAESFHQKNNSLLVSISGGGSGLGIASLLNGTADIANSSRRINEGEMLLFKEKNIELDSFIFAQDAIAFVVSNTLPIDSIGVSDLSKILNGEYKDWSHLLQENIPINIYGRQSNSGTYEFVKDILNIHFSPYAKQMNGNAQILEAIKADNSGIGYVGAGYVKMGDSKEIKVLKIYTDNQPSISPLDSAKIASGEYFFQRPLFQYYKKSDYEKVKPFLDFEKTERGTAIINASGYYPIKKVK